VHKYVDDTTLSEVLPPKELTSNMETYLHNLTDWANLNDMQLNTAKAKEMILGPVARANLPLLTTTSTTTTTTDTIHRVTSFKLLGVYIDSTMSWTIHVDNMVKKATRRLYFLKQLKRAGLTSKQLFHYYTAVIRPVLECCAPVWHYALTKSQTQQLEAIQKRAIQIVLNFSRGMPYSSVLYAADLNALASRREDISRKLFHNITMSTSCLHHLLPDPKSPSHNSRLRSYEKFPLNDIVHLCSTH